MKNKIIINIVFVYFVVISIVLAVQLYHVNNNARTMPVTQTVQLADRLNNAVVLCGGSPVLLVDQHQTLISSREYDITPTVRDGSFYAPLSFFEAAYGAVCEQDLGKKQATIRLDNKAIVFDENAVIARLVSNSSEKELELEERMFFKNAHAYIPISAFCDAFSKETFVYDDDMLIISPAEENVAFDPNAEAELLQDIKLQVNNLPLVLSESNLKQVLGINTGLFGFSQGKEKTADRDEGSKLLLAGMQSKKAAVLGDFLYVITGKNITVSDSSADISAAFAEFSLPEGIVPETLMIYDDMLYITGHGKDAVLPAVEITFGGSGDNRSDIEKSVKGERLFLLCYSLENRTEPALKRWFCAEGELAGMESFDNTLCLAVRQNALDLIEGDICKTPVYHDLNKDISIEFDEIKYLPEMKDTFYTSVYRFDLADPAKEADADVFLGIGADAVLGQNYVQFASEGKIPSDDNKTKFTRTNIYHLNINSGVLTKAYLDAAFVDMERVSGGSAVLAKADGKNVLYTLNADMQTGGGLELPAGDLSVLRCDGDRAYMTNAVKSRLVVAGFMQMNDESGEDTQTVLQAQVKTEMPLGGVEYIHPYETSLIGIGKNREQDNAEISMWSLKENAEKTASDSVGAAGSGISPVYTKNFVASELGFNIRLFVKEGEVPEEKYNGLYIYNISENNMPVYKGRITHNAENGTDVSITDAVYLNGRYFTLSEHMLKVSADDDAMTELYKKDF